MYQLRKGQNYRVYIVTQVANLDPEKFRNLPTPYEGSSEEDFMKYIDELGYDVYDMYEELDEETKGEIDKLYDNAEWDEVYNSTWDGEDSWIEIGERDEKYRKTGGFNIRFDSQDS